MSGSYYGTVCMESGESGEAIGEPLQGHESSETSACMSKDGKVIMSESDDGGAFTVE